jgi:ATP-dependent DNA helicase PIF1
MESLSDQQQEVFNKYIKGENIFMTGPGGSGKTYLIKMIVNHAEENEIKHQVCALTGCASILLNCKATTLHRFAGIGLANKLIDIVISELFAKKYKLKKWYNLKVLIIDEVSMMSLKLFLILDIIARKIYKKPNIPFGGLQIIFSGDFYQLPPIKSSDEEKEASQFCFEHKLWNETFPKENQIILKTIFRQEETDFLKVLKYVRRGQITHSTKAILENKVYTKEELEKIRQEKVVTIISPYKKDVDYINTKSYSELRDNVEKRTYKIKFIQGSSSKKKQENSINNINDDLHNLLINSNASLKQDYEFLANNIMANQEIELKIGTHVMCIANVALDCEIQIANGSQGIVVGFRNDLPLIKFNNISDPICVDYFVWNSETNKKVAVAQIPLIYAWAITIHKSQGVTLDAAIMDIGTNIFEYGQTYVALSRVKTLAGLYLSNFDYTKISANPKVKRFYGDSI